MTIDLKKISQDIDYLNDDVNKLKNQLSDEVLPTLKYQTELLKKIAGLDQSSSPYTLQNVFDGLDGLRATVADLEVKVDTVRGIVEDE